MSGSVASRDRHAVTSGPVVAFGPIAEGWGSWDWVGADVCRELGKSLTTFEFAAWEIPDAEVVFLVKHTPPPGWVEAVTRRSVLIYAPVDHYSAAAEIDADASLLRRCSRILIHCERLRRYFEPYAPVEYMDHHVKFVAPIRDEFRTEGEILWVGVRTNLPPLVDWVNAHPLPVPLRVLTNPEDPYLVPSPLDVGFRKGSDVAIERWTPENHIEHASKCRAFFDIKANDFRSRHKPPAKGIDAIASGLPLAIDLDSSTAEHLARMGFEACPPHESERWLSRGYLDETRRFGAVLRELLSPVRIGRRYKHLFECVP
jgi:hypothetical protein